MGYLTVKDSVQYLWLLGIAGISVCFLWSRLIRSYKDLNSAKFKVIHVIEKRLPLSPYDAEWIAMGEGKNPDLYKPVTHIEIAVPWIFVALHLFVVVRAIPWGYLLGLLR